MRRYWLVPEIVRKQAWTFLLVKLTGSCWPGIFIKLVLMKVRKWNSRLPSSMMFIRFTVHVVPRKI